MNPMNVLNAVSIVACLAGLNGCGQAPASVADFTAQAPIAQNPVAGPVLPEAAPLSDPLPDPSPTVSASPLPPPTIVSYIYQNSVGICNAVRNWNPATTTIVFPLNSGGSTIVTFAATGILISDANGSNAGAYTGTITKAGVLNAPPVCTITVNLGSLSSIQ